ncbi:hypothetical protein GH714_020278 [Hevea brasiliensis]|uniref:Flavin-containing monooxygenase n=1 Tax=Hevea brasiliensis TaxID=3981 RepID=A0A6A6N2K5_HEVBR|nr:hypothetical protein GH714_020278 [Hevea brasiliensis]
MHATQRILFNESVHVVACKAEYLSMRLVDAMVTLLSRMQFCDLSKFGICRPRGEPFTHKIMMRKTPVLDVAAAIENINDNMVKFSDGLQQYFDAMVFAKGYRSVPNKCLKDYSYTSLTERALPRNPFPICHGLGDSTNNPCGTYFGKD